MYWYLHLAFCMNWRVYLPVNSHRSDPPFFGILQYFETILSWFCHLMLHRSISLIQQFHNLFHATHVKYYLTWQEPTMQDTFQQVPPVISVFSHLWNRVLSEETFDNYSQKTVIHLMGETKYRMHISVWAWLPITLIRSSVTSYCAWSVKIIGNWG